MKLLSSSALKDASGEQKRSAIVKHPSAWALMRLELQNICHLLWTTRAHLNENKHESFGAGHLTVRKTTATRRRRYDFRHVKKNLTYSNFYGFYFLRLLFYGFDWLVMTKNERKPNVTLKEDRMLTVRQQVS